MQNTGVAAKRHSVVDAQFPGQRFVVFCREEDHPDRDITEATGFSAKDTFSRTGYAPTALAAADDTAARGSAEFLRVEVCSRGGGGGGGHHSSARSAVSAWAVGRVSLRVEARSFDRSLSEERQVAAGTAFMASWALTMQVCARNRRAGAGCSVHGCRGEALSTFFVEVEIAQCRVNRLKVEMYSYILYSRGVLSVNEA